MSRINFPLLAAQALLAVAGMAAAPLHAAPADNSQPTLVDADSLHYDDLKQTSVFTGNVVLTKGTLVLHSDRLELHEDAEGYQYGVATADGGKLVHVRQQQQDPNEYIDGVGERVEYDGRSQLMHFISKAVVKRLLCDQMVDEVRGQQVTYNERTETYSATGGPQAPTPNQRVRTIIQPKGSQAPAGAPASTCAPAASDKAKPQ